MSPKQERLFELNIYRYVYADSTLVSMYIETHTYTHVQHIGSSSSRRVSAAAAAAAAARAFLLLRSVAAECDPRTAAYTLSHSSSAVLCRSTVYRIPCTVYPVPVPVCRNVMANAALFAIDPIFSRDHL